MPDIGRAPGKVLPFFPIYNFFEDVDFIAWRASNWDSAARTHPKPMALEELRARVKDAIDERYLLRRPNPAVPAGGTWPQPPAQGPDWPQPFRAKTIFGITPITPDRPKITYPNLARRSPARDKMLAFQD